MSTCWNCARIYDSKVTCSPLHYCSFDCYAFGSKPYNKTSLEGFGRSNKVEIFAIKLIDRIHWLQHNNDDRFDCEWDLCVEAKILGL